MGRCLVPRLDCQTSIGKEPASPIAITSDNNFVWVANPASKTVYVGAGTGVATCPTTATVGTLTGVQLSPRSSLLKSLFAAK